MPAMPPRDLRLSTHTSRPHSEAMGLCNQSSNSHCNSKCGRRSSPQPIRSVLPTCPRYALGPHPHSGTPNCYDGGPSQSWRACCKTLASQVRTTPQSKGITVLPSPPLRRVRLTTKRLQLERCVPHHILSDDTRRSNIPFLLDATSPTGKY